MVTLIVIGLAIAAGFTLVPHSVRLFMAGVATCDSLEAALQESPDDGFQALKPWEKPLALLYRLKYWFSQGPARIDDSAAGKSNVFSVLVTAAESTGGECDPEILQLLDRYLDGSESPDDYDATGYTALHQAIVFHKPGFVHALLAGGADSSLRVRSGNALVDGKTAVELAVWLSEQAHSPPSADTIAEMLTDQN